MFEEAKIQTTFMMIKPDGVQRKLVGEIIKRGQKLNLQILRLSLTSPPEQKFKKHYSKHSQQPYFNNLIQYMKSGPVVIIVWHGQNAILRIRKILADTDRNCSCGTIRGDYAVMTGHFSIENDRVINATKNVCHASDSEQEAASQITNWFPDLVVQSK